MWPIMVFRVLRVYAPYITVPFAAVIGYVGYNIENFVSDKYTPFNEVTNEGLLNGKEYNSLLEKIIIRMLSMLIFLNIESIKESRSERLIADEKLESAASVETLKYSANVLGKNVSPSLQQQ